MLENVSNCKKYNCKPVRKCYNFKGEEKLIGTYMLGKFSRSLITIMTLAVTLGVPGGQGSASWRHLPEFSSKSK